MNRRWWFLIPFAAQAQETGQFIATPKNVSVCMDKPVRRCNKPVNNECPTCGTMAVPYVRTTEGLTGCGPVPCGANGTCFAVCTPWTVDHLPKSRSIRCDHCNAAFWQDAEVQP